MSDTVNDVKTSPKYMDVVDIRLNPAARSHPQHSVTLRRDSVKQPAQDNHNQTSIPVSYAQQDEDQADTALNIPVSLTEQSPLISRFAPYSDQPEETQTSQLDQQAYPSMEQGTLAESEPLEAEPVQMSEAGELAAEWPNLSLDNLLPNFDNTQAKPHKSKWHKAKHISGWTILAIILVGVIGGGIFINRNISKLELYLASSKVGFSATLPGIKPSGFDLSSIATGSGALQASFKSNTDGRNYSITEKKSNISENQLLSNYVQPQAGENYQTINTANRTIYVYNGHDATWIYGGIWYTLLDNNSLSYSQIINIATST